MYAFYYIIIMTKKKKTLLMIVVVKVWSIVNLNPKLSWFLPKCLIN